MSDTTTQSRGISGEDLDLLSRLLEQEGFGAPASTAIPRRAVFGSAGEELPLSYAQQRLWFLDRLQPGSAQYNLYSARRFPQPIALTVLARTLGELARRHETLRTTFVEVQGRAVQVIAPPPRAAVPPVIDLLGLPNARREDEVARVAGAESRRPFDLSRGPLWRAAVVHVGEGEDVLLSVMHHIISDGGSLGVMMGEVSRLYAAFAAGRPSPLPELAIQYADFALWQRERLEGGELARELDFWRAELLGAPQVLDLPADRPRPAVQSFRGANEMFSIPATDAARLRELAREEGATLFMAMLATLGATLGRITGRFDLLISSPIANRNRPEIEALIGFFVNTLVLRVDLAGEPSLREMIRRTKLRTLAAYDHQNLPFEKLVEELRPERDLAHAPLVQVMLALQTEDAPAMPAGGGAGGATAASEVPLMNGTAKLDLLISMIESSRGLNGMAEYATDLFEGATVRRLLDAWRTLIAGALATPEAADRPLAELPLLDAAETRRLVVDWNDTAVAYDQAGARLHDLVFAQAAATPDAIAVVFEESALSYGALARAAQRLAQSLRRRGIGPEIAVGVCLERSLEMPVALLAVLEAGGFYVPLDPDYPADRLTYMLADSRVPLVLISAAVQARIADLPEGVVRVDPGDWETLNPVAPELVERATTEPETLAYAIYTSGSTGKPKAGMNAHRGIVNRLLWMRERYALGPADRVLQKTPFSFDVSVWELFLPLLSGARLVMARPGGHQDAGYLVDLISREGVSVLHFVPSMLQVFVGEPGVAELSSLRALICSGEALPSTLVDRFFALFSGHLSARQEPELHNLYGPTEAAVDVTEQVCLPGLATVPIGRPIANLRIYLLDPERLPVPVGVPGELFIGGVGVGRGYLHRPQLTAAAFVPDGIGGEPGARLYRTGDLCRFAVDGAIEYLGRIDHQVKIRGFRIELGEIERALADHPDVSECVVATYGPATDRRIAAYLVAGSSKPPSIEELRTFLGRSLPLYMIPQAFVALPALPLSPNGKIDRKALPTPELSRPSLGEQYVAPRTVAEQVLAVVWEHVLGVEQVGAHDNFFALGGDSIRSIQVLAMARERGLEISLQQLFQHQTIAALAAVAVTPSAVEAPTEPFSLLAPEDRQRLPSGPGFALDDAYPLAMLQAGMLFHMVLRPEDPPYHNVDSWQLVARFDAEAFARATADVVARHPVMRTSFHLTGFSEPIQMVHREAALPLTVFDLIHLTALEQQREVAALVRAEKLKIFDFTRAPQLRFHVHRLAEDRFQFTLTENHAIFDGWSLHSTLAEIFSRYFAYLRGETPAFEAPLALTYRDFVAAERRTLESESAKAFWREQLAGASVLELPRPNPVTQAPVGARVCRLIPNLSPEISRAVRSLARRSAVPLKSVLLGAHFKVMSLLSGSPDVMIGIGFNGRAELSGGDDVRGLFLNTLPVRFEVKDESFARISERAFETERDILPHRRYPYNRLQQENSGRPFYDVIFNYIHFHVVDKMLAHEEIGVVGFHAAEGTNFLLQVAFAPGTDEQGIHFALEYDGARLSETDAAWIAGYFTRYFAALGQDPDASTATASLLAPEEREQIRAATALAVSPVALPSLVELFARAVATHGKREAVRCGNAGLTYAELDRRANALAHRLIRDGVLPGDLVAVSLDRSTDLIVALLAVLKSGAGYVPIDPTYPEERRAFLLKDSGARLLLDEVAADLAQEDHAAPVLRITAADVAYVIYTSGSTGKPKGVPVRHGEVARLMSSTDSWFGFGPDDVWTLFHSYAFDFSVWEIWGALAYGGRLIVVPTAISRAPESFYRLVRDEKVTVLNQTPSAFQQLIWAERGVFEADGPAPLALRYVIFGGEALDLPTLAPWIERHPDSTLINMYGITETTVHVTYRPIGKADVLAKRGSLIGVPIPDLAVHVLDAFGMPAPLGVSGEMYVSGAGLAVGYLGRPELTAERFVPDSFSGAVGARAYRSGDLARRLPAVSGFDLEYLGRIDNQVKIRGFRIELAEIEAVLAAHPGVRRAIVVPREDVAGDKRLVAYVVLADSSISADDLRGAAQANLPEYMVPAAVVILPELPLTPHGKVDVRALPLPAGTREASRQAFVEPRTPLEERIAAIWAEVLRLEKVGVRDGFFDLGGNSILATQVFARLRETFGFEVPMRTLFEEPTIERLAVTIGELQARGPSAEAESQRIARRRSEGDAVGAVGAIPAAPKDADKIRTDLAAMTPEAIRKLLAEKRAKKQQGGQG